MESGQVKHRQTLWFNGVTGLSVVEIFSVVRKILVKLTREPAVAYGFGSSSRMRQAI